MAFDPKKIDRLAAKATLLEEQVAALVRELEELAEAARTEAATPAPAPAPVVETVAAPDPGAGSASEAAAAAAAGWAPAMPEPIAEPEAAEPEPEPEPQPVSAPEPEPARPAVAAPEGARLVALNMALRGTPRDETARYLRENYDFEESDALLDDVYAKAGS